MHFSLHTSPTTDIIRSHGLKHHLHADDTQLYLAFNPACSEDLVTATSCVEACDAEIRVWMSRNHLKLNDDKSELLVFHTRHSPRPDTSNIMVGEEGVTPTASCRKVVLCLMTPSPLRLISILSARLHSGTEEHLEDSHLPG